MEVKSINKTLLLICLCSSLYLASCTMSINKESFAELAISPSDKATKRPLFIHQDIQDSLEAFIADLDYFPNPWDAPIITEIVVSKSISDTIVTFYSCFHVYLVEAPGINYNKACLTYLKNRTVIVKYYGSIVNMSNLINKSLLSEIRYEIMKEIDHYSNTPPVEYRYLPYSKRYLLKNNKLILVSCKYPYIGNSRLLLNSE